MVVVVVMVVVVAVVLALVEVVMEVVANAMTSVRVAECVCSRSALASQSGPFIGEHIVCLNEL